MPVGRMGRLVPLSFTAPCRSFSPWREQGRWPLLYNSQGPFPVYFLLLAQHFSLVAGCEKRSPNYVAQITE